MVDLSFYKQQRPLLEDYVQQNIGVQRAREAEDIAQQQQAETFATQQAMDKLKMQQKQMEIDAGVLPSQGSVPAALQLANEYQSAIKSGDINRANTIAAFAKTVDKNLQMTPQGTYQPLPGAGQALGQLEAQKAQAKVTGKALGESQALLSDVESFQPKLENVVNKLSELGKKATYTKAGIARDFALRELGQPISEAGIARAEYIATVDNEVLPLLKQTFGAAFTEREGAKLSATLGDPNKSPPEKDAVLKAFIEQKRTQIEALQRRTGQNPTTPVMGTVEDGYVFMGGNPADSKNWKKK